MDDDNLGVFDCEIHVVFLEESHLREIACKNAFFYRNGVDLQRYLIFDNAQFELFHYGFELSPDVKS